MPEERLQKILAHAGVASRRQAEQIILEGRVTVNGTVISELGSKADLDRDHIKVDGRLIHAPRRQVYIALHKPNNTVTTVSDPQGRATVMDLLRGVKERVYPVGRLDYHSEGLLLLTNDGEMANAVMSAATHLPKTYVVKANGALTEGQEEEFRQGIPLGGRRTKPAGLKLIREAENPWYEVRLYEGRNNQIRLMFKHFGRLVEKLKRVRIGPLDLGPLKPGQFRHLDEEEIRKLRRAIEHKPAPPVIQRDRAVERKPVPQQKTGRPRTPREAGPPAGHKGRPRTARQDRSSTARQDRSSTARQDRSSTARQDRSRTVPPRRPRGAA